MPLACNDISLKLNILLHVELSRLIFRLAWGEQTIIVSSHQARHDEMIFSKWSATILPMIEHRECAFCQGREHWRYCRLHGHRLSIMPARRFWRHASVQQLIIATNVCLHFFDEARLRLSANGRIFLATSPMRATINRHWHMKCRDDGAICARNK